MSFSVVVVGVDVGVVVKKVVMGGWKRRRLEVVEVVGVVVVVLGGWGMVGIVIVGFGVLVLWWCGFLGG